MRAVIAMISHETNSFSPIRADWHAFENWGAALGKQAAKAHRHTRLAFSAYLHAAQKAGWTVETPVAARAYPSGPVTDDAFERMAGAVYRAVRKGADAVMLDLHGAMMTRSLPDAEGEFLRRIRDLAPGIPVCVTCDLHANITPDMADNCDVLVGYKTYPHTDMYESGQRAAEILIEKIRGKSDPSVVWDNLPLLAHTLCMGHEDEPMKSLLASARSMEDRDVPALTLFGGFPLSDLREAGVSAVAVADGSRQNAERAVRKILEEAWQRRAEFVYAGEPVSAALSRALSLREHPVILLDHADNVGSGGTQDVMTVISEVVRRGFQNTAVASVCDPRAVREMAAAGVGARVTVKLGGKTGMPEIGLKGEPMLVTGRVKALTDGTFTSRGPMFTGTRVNMGRSAVLDTGGIEIVVTSNRCEPWDREVFTSMGIDPAKKKYLLLKSRIHYRAAFGGLARHTVRCDGRGVTASDQRIFGFKNLRRPVYPLDPQTPFRTGNHG